MEKEIVSWGWAGPQWVKNIWVTYKITTEQFNVLWSKQQGRCGGCEEELAHPLRKEMRTGVKPQVDHDHKTGEVRGILCRRCNMFLGKIRDNKEILRNLAEYLQLHGEKLL